MALKIVIMITDTTICSLNTEEVGHRISIIEN